MILTENINSASFYCCDYFSKLQQHLEQFGGTDDFQVWWVNVSRFSINLRISVLGRGAKAKSVLPRVPLHISHLHLHYVDRKSRRA